MTKLNECMQVLREVLSQNDPKNIVLAEAAIDQLLTNALPADRFLVVSALKSAILKATENRPSRFAGLIFDCIENRAPTFGDNADAEAPSALKPKRRR